MAILKYIVLRVLTVMATPACFIVIAMISECDMV